MGLGGLTVLIAAEITMQLLPVKTGFERITEKDNDDPLYWTPYQTFTHSAGWRLDNPHTARMNNLGYVSPHDYLDGTRAIIVLGDSFVENQMNAYNDSFMGLLDGESPLPVYNFGLSGASIADYLGQAHFVTERYKPDHIYIVVTDGDVTSSTKPYQPGHFFFKKGNQANQWILEKTEYERAASFRRNIVKNSALLRYLFLNLKFHIKVKNFLGMSNALHPYQDEDRMTALQSPDSLRIALYQHFQKELCTIMESHNFNITLLIDNAALPVDMRECPQLEIVSINAAFEAYQKANPFDKLQHLPYDAHWNETGHRVIYDALKQTKTID